MSGLEGHRPLSAVRSPTIRFGARIRAGAAVMAMIAAGLAAVVGAAPVSAAAITRAYVVIGGSEDYGDSHSTLVIDPDTGSIVTTVTVGTNPGSVAVNPTGTRAYVTNSGPYTGSGPGVPGTVSVVDTATNKVAATITVGLNPYGVAISHDGSRAYINNSSSGTVSVIDTNANAVVASIAVGGHPGAIAVNRAGTRAYVTGFDSNSLAIIDTISRAVVANVAVAGPTDVAVLPDGTAVYVPNWSSNTVSVVDTATNRVAATVPVGGRPSSVAINPTGTRVYVLNTSSNTISVIDTAANTVLATVPAGSDTNSLAISPDGTRVYVTHGGLTGELSVLDAATYTVVTTVTAGHDLRGVAIGTQTTTAPTTTRLTMSPIVSGVNQKVDFTATVTPTPSTNAGIPTGEIRFFVDGSPTPAAAVTIVNGQASYSTTFGGGRHSVVAAYLGDRNFAPSTSSPVIKGDSCKTTVTGAHQSIVTAAGTTCVLSAHITGTVIVRPGTILDIENSSITGSVVADAAATIRVCRTTISGSVTVQRSTRFVLIGDPSDDRCAPNTVGGSLVAQFNTGGLEVLENTVTGPTISRGNSGTGPLSDDTAPEVNGWG